MLDDTHAVEAALAILRASGIDISSPRDGDLDDLEQERFNAVVDSCRTYARALSTVTPAEVSDLVDRLREGTFGSDTTKTDAYLNGLMREAATALAAKDAELAEVKAERDEHKRLKSALVLKAYRAMDSADDLVEALRRYGFPVSDAAETALMEGGSREAQALHKAAKAFIAARRALEGGTND